MDNVLIFEPFNMTTILFFLIFSAATILLSVLARKKGPEFARLFLGIWCLVVVCYYIFFKIGLQLDSEYNNLRIAGGMPEVSIWTELPIQLCDINLLMLPLAVLLRRNTGFLKFFIIFFGIPGALLAMIVPFPGFTGYSLLIPRVFGYYFTHGSIIFSAISLISFGLYKPSLYDFRRAALLLAAVYAVTFGINVILRSTGLSLNSNFFFSYAPIGIAPLEILYKLIPVPGLYLAVPAIILLTIIYFIAFFISKISKHNHAAHRHSRFLE